MNICSTKLFLPAYYERLYGGTGTTYLKETISTFNGNTYGNFKYYDNATASGDSKYSRFNVVYQSNLSAYWLRSVYYQTSNTIRYYAVSTVSGQTMTCGTFGSAGTSSSQRAIAPIFAM